MQGMVSACFAAALLSVGVLCAQDRIEPPVSIKQVQPEYPHDLKSFVVEPARVEMVIDQQGVPFSLTSVTSLPDHIVEALMAWRYRPARKNGAVTAFRIPILVPIHRPVQDMIGRMSRSWGSSKDANDAFRAAKTLDAAGAARLEEELAANPENLNARMTLLAYNASDAPGALSMRLRQIAWFANRDLKANILGSPLASPGMTPPTDSETYEQIRQIWLRQLALNAADPEILDHATNFLRFSDPEAVEAATQKLKDETDRAAVFLGDLLGLSALGVTAVDPLSGRGTAAGSDLPSTPFAVKARGSLAKTDDLRVLYSAVSAVSAAGWSLGRAGHAPAGYMEFCQELLTRTKGFYPDTPATCDAPPQPVSVEPKLRIGGNIQAANLIKQVRPEYPEGAKSRGITGTVKFQATIGKDGSIQNLEMIGGPFALYKSARDAVSRWKYKPTLLNGNPVQVITTIDVNYMLGGR
jgi:TonB family protein